MSGVRKRKLMAEINVVPYIDVMLVLLIIFMVTAPMLTQGIDVELPKAGAEPIDPTENAEPLVLSVDADGNLYLNVGEDEDSPVEAARIVQMASTVLERKPETPVLVKADFRVPYGSVVSAMVLLQRAGAEKVGFLTDPAELETLPAG
ncbi:MAG: protein TolR [Gammaproteobacteria bacterium]|nr:protein TolR [Gammaproteobacteria bacterium]